MRYSAVFSFQQASEVTHKVTIHIRMAQNNPQQASKRSGSLRLVYETFVDKLRVVSAIISPDEMYSHLNLYKHKDVSV